MGQPRLCLPRTIKFGGDADTMATMVGALLGALFGIHGGQEGSWIKENWFTSLEEGNETYGKDFIVRKAIGLAMSVQPVMKLPEGQVALPPEVNLSEYSRKVQKAELERL